MSANLLIEALGVAEATKAERTGKLLAAARSLNEAAAAILASAIEDELLEEETVERLANAFRMTVEAEGMSLDEVPGSVGAVHAAITRFLDGWA